MDECVQTPNTERYDQMVFYLLCEHRAINVCLMPMNSIIQISLWLKWFPSVNSSNNQATTGQQRMRKREKSVYGKRDLCVSFVVKGNRHKADGRVRARGYWKYIYFMDVEYDEKMDNETNTYIINCLA